LQAARAVRCEAEQVIVVAGSAQALDLVGRVLLDPGDGVWVEDPGYLGVHAALSALGARVSAVPVDADGLDVAVGAQQCPNARLVYVTPSRQYPTGAVMPLPRRLALLAWARAAGAWVLEDDFDSEYRYAGRPLPALQGLDSEQRVLYVGTFSRAVFPTLRLGYLVVPPDLVEAFTRVRAVLDRGSPLLEQAVVAAFIADGHMARHIRRMRTVYAERQAVLVEAARSELAGFLELVPAEAGIHLLGWLPTGVNDRPVADRATRHGVEARPLSDFRVADAARGGLLLGYAAYPPEAIRTAVRTLAAAASLVQQQGGMPSYADVEH
jgi:GntR family transcriptional regulator/MocR family aminotransferase